MRAALRYLGAKNALAPWICSFFPPHRVYVEPFGGSAAVLLNKEPAQHEVYNDMNGRLVNFFRQIRENHEKLCHAIELTPYSQEEYAASKCPSEDPLEDARRFAVYSMMSYGATGAKANFRRTGMVRRTSCGLDWMRYPENLREVAMTLRQHHAEINCMDALELIPRYDSPETLYYADPPYPRDMRVSRYDCEFSKHEELLGMLRSLKGYVVISSYENELYSQALVDWHKEVREVKTTQNSKREEILWMNFKPQGLLFDMIGGGEACD